MHLYLAESCDLHALDRVFPQIKDIVGEHDEVLDVLVVDLKETYSDRVVAIDLVTLHLLEHFFHCVEHDARVFLIAEHGVGLAGTGLPVRKDGRVEAVEHPLAQEFGSVFEDVQLRCSLIEGKVKGVLLLLGPIFAKDFLLGHHVGRVPEDHDVLVEDLDNADLALILLLFPHGPEADGDQNLRLSLLHLLDVLVRLYFTSRQSKASQLLLAESGALGRVLVRSIRVV